MYPSIIQGVSVVPHFSFGCFLEHFGTEILWARFRAIQDVVVRNQVEDRCPFSLNVDTRHGCNVKAPDRAVALDVLTLITLPLLVGVAAAEGRIVYLDVAVVYALLSFLGVVALARYYDRGV